MVSEQLLIKTPDTPTAKILKDVGKSVEFGRRDFFLSFWN